MSQMTARHWRSLLEQEKGKRDHISKQIDKIKREIRLLNRRLKHIDMARGIIIAVARQTQSQLEYHIGEVVSLALTAVLDEPYEFKLEFVEKRGKTETQLWLTSSEKKQRKSSRLSRTQEEATAPIIYDPMSATGGGVVDISSFALRVALWSLRRPKSRAVLVLDEPFRFLSRSLHPRASMMMKEVSEKLGLQIIMVSHSEDLMDGADRVFQVRKRRGVSEMESSED